jgi:hypothetical protein
MMNPRMTNAGMLACTLLLCAAPISGQIRFVQILRFEVDGKQRDEKLRVFLKLGNRLIEPLRFENGFVVPAELGEQEKLDVRLIFGKYDLYFESIHASAFKTNWIVGVDEAPFDPDNIEPAPPPGKKLKLVYYIQFVPRDAEETRMVVRIYK